MSKRCTLVCTCKHISCGVGECCTVTVHKNKGAQCAAPGRHRVRRFTVHDVKRREGVVYPYSYINCTCICVYIHTKQNSKKLFMCPIYCSFLEILQSNHKLCCSACLPNRDISICEKEYGHTKEI